MAIAYFLANAYMLESASVREGLRAAGVAVLRVYEGDHRQSAVLASSEMFNVPLGVYDLVFSVGEGSTTVEANPTPYYKLPWDILTLIGDASVEVEQAHKGV